MILPVDAARNDFDIVSGILNMAAGPTGSSPRSQNPSTPDPATNETEQLLDLDGLLEITRLIGKIKKEGRLVQDGKESPSKLKNKREPRHGY